MRVYKVEAAGVVIAKSADKLPRGWSASAADAYELAVADALSEQSAAAAAFEAAADRVRRLREAMVREVLG